MVIFFQGPPLQGSKILRGPPFLHQAPLTSVCEWSLMFLCRDLCLNGKVKTCRDVMFILLLWKGYKLYFTNKNQDSRRTLWCFMKWTKKKKRKEQKILWEQCTKMYQHSQSICQVLTWQMLWLCFLASLEKVETFSKEAKNPLNIL